MAEEEIEQQEVQQPKGAFLASLQRSKKEVVRDRAQVINEEAQIIYKRTIEDMQHDIRRLQRERESMLDLSPTHADSLVPALDFNSKDFVEKDLSIGVQIRNLEIKLEIARDQYAHLFGKL